MWASQQLSGKEFSCYAGDAEMWVCSLSWEDPLEKDMATNSSILAWEIPWTEEPSRTRVHRVTKESDMT